MSILTLLNIAIFQGIVIGFILLHSPFFKSKTNQYLAFAIFSLSWSLLNLVLDTTQIFDKYPILKIVDIVDSSVLFPVLILLFTIHQVNHPQRHSKHLIWLFVPFIFSVVHSVLEEFTTDIQAIGSAYFINLTSTILGIILFLITLFFIPIVLIKTYHFIRFSKNPTERKWLTSLWLFEVVFLMSWLLAILLSLVIEREISNAMNIIALFITLLIHWVAYVGVYKFKLANEQKQIKALLLNGRMPLEVTTVGAKVPKQVSEENIYYLELERLCSNQKIYKDSTLDRNKVAEMLGISPSYVSQLINSIAGENFSTYINRYRVEEVKNLILDKEFNHYSLLSIGLESGFSSKTTYYNWFKKMTNMTPNTYRKVHQ